jgi:hypothetical protein
VSEENNNEEYILVWDAPVIEAPEFRLYYKEDGSVDFYTCDKPEGNYIIIDALAFAESRPDIKVVNGRIAKIRPHAIVQKLKPSDKGQLTSIEDISIIIDSKKIKDKDDIRVQHWELCDHEID